MKQAGGPAKHTQAQHHITELTDGGVGQYTLDVRCHHGDRRGKEQGDGADISDRQKNFRNKHREKTPDQIDTRSHHGGRVNQC